MNKQAYIVCGPTASGKTSLSIQLAKRIGGEIINADAMQVYEDIPTLSAMPTIQERQNIPHHLFGYLDCFAVNNVNLWLNQVQQIFNDIERPIFVGGTGMYIKALMDGLSPIPDIPEEIRTQVRQMDLYDIKKQLKTPVPYTDSQRLMRALEVEYATGKSILWWHQQPQTKVLKNVDFKVICIIPPREKLYSHCNDRFIQMLNNGALQELVSLVEKNPQQTGGVFSVLGALNLLAFLQGKMTLEQATQKSQQETRNYAKRQITWFKHQINPDILLDAPVLP